MSSGAPYLRAIIPCQDGLNAAICSQQKYFKKPLAPVCLFVIFHAPFGLKKGRTA
jgi:hypothetical protein